MPTYQDLRPLTWTCILLILKFHNCSRFHGTNIKHWQILRAVTMYGEAFVILPVILLHRPRSEARSMLNKRSPFLFALILLMSQKTMADSGNPKTPPPPSSTTQCPVRCSPRKVDIKKIANVNMELQAASARAKPDMERSLDSERQNVMSGLHLDHLKYGPDRYGYATILNTQCLGTIIYHKTF